MLEKIIKNKEKIIDFGIKFIIWYFLIVGIVGIIGLGWVLSLKEDCGIHKAILYEHNESVIPCWDCLLGDYLAKDGNIYRMYLVFNDSIVMTDKLIDVNYCKVGGEYMIYEVYLNDTNITE